MRESAAVAVYPVEPDAQLAQGDAVSSREGRSTDASRLTFPVQMLIGAVVMTATILGAVYGMTSGIRESQLETASDIRDLRTRIEMAAQVNAADKRAQDMIFETTAKTVEQLRAQVQLLQLQYAELSKRIR